MYTHNMLSLCFSNIYLKIPSNYTHLSLEDALRSNDFLKDVLSNVRVDCTEWVIQQVDVCLLVDSPRQTHSLLLTSTQVDTLW